MYNSCELYSDWQRFGSLLLEISHPGKCGKADFITVADFIIVCLLEQSCCCFTLSGLIGSYVRGLWDFFLSGGVWFYGSSSKWFKNGVKHQK